MSKSATLTFHIGLDTYEFHVDNYQLEDHLRKLGHPVSNVSLCIFKGQGLTYWLRDNSAVVISALGMPKLGFIVSEICACEELLGSDISGTDIQMLVQVHD